MSEQARGIRSFAERRGGRPTRRADGYVVAAGKGGVGTSTVALLLAFAARQHGPVVLVDAQEGLGGLPRIIGLGESPDGLDPDARQRPRRVDLAPDLALVHGPAGAATDPGRRSALRRMALADQDPLVIVDAGSRPAGVLQALNDYGTRLVLVAGRDTVSPAASYALAKAVWMHRPETRVSALGNRTDEGEARITHDALRLASERFAGRPIHWLGHLPEAPSLNDNQVPEWAALDASEPALVRSAVAATRRMLGIARPNTSTLSLVK